MNGVTVSESMIYYRIAESIGLLMFIFGALMIFEHEGELSQLFNKIGKKFYGALTLLFILGGLSLVFVGARNPSNYGENYILTRKSKIALSIGMFVLGLIISVLFQAFPKLEKFAGDFGQDAKTICLAFPWVVLLLSLMSYRPPIKDTLNSSSKPSVSEYIGNLSNDEYIDMEKQVRAYSHQVSLDSELDRAVNNYLTEILDK